MSLNKSKGNMFKLPNLYTWNPLKGQCQHMCAYCLPAGTKILMGDYTAKNIEDVSKGDVIIGINDGGGFKKYTRGTVTNTIVREATTIRLKTDMGTLECTPEHPLLEASYPESSHDWKRAIVFRVFNKIRYVGMPTAITTEFKRGWLSGYCDGDGCFFYPHDKRNGITHCAFTAVSIDADIRTQLIKFANDFGVELCESTHYVSKHNQFSTKSKYPCVHSWKTHNVEKFNNITKFDEHAQDEYYRGYIAGITDAEGNIGKEQWHIRISQTKTLIRKHIEYALEKCKLRYVVELYSGKVGTYRLLGGRKVKLDLLFNYPMACMRKRDNLIINHTVKCGPAATIISIEAGEHKPVYNIETTCGNYIANGFMVHNCFVEDLKRNPMLEAKYSGIPRLAETYLEDNLGKDRYIFVCDCTDLFAANVPAECIRRILHHLARFPLNKNLLLTKNPARFNEFIDIIPSNCILGTTIETDHYYDKEMSKAPPPEERARALGAINTQHLHFVSIEPIMTFEPEKLLTMIQGCRPEFVFVGADSGYPGRLKEPDKTTLKTLIAGLKGITDVKLKDNINRLLEG